MRGDDDPPVIEVVQTSPDARSEIAVASGGARRRRQAAVAAVVLLLVALTIGLGGSDGEPAVDEQGGAPSTVPTAPTTTAPERGGLVAATARPLFGDEAVDASVLLGSAERGWRLVDLATGFAEPVPVLDGVAPRRLLPVRGGVVVLEDEDFGRLQLVPLVSSEAGEAKLLDFWPDVADSRVAAIVGVSGSGSPDRFWAVSTQMRPDPGRLAATLVDLEGDRLLGPFDLPVEPVAGTAHGLVYNAGGRVQLSGADGARDLAPGEAHAASAAAVGVITCEEPTGCVQAIVTVPDGEVTRGHEVPLGVAAEGSVTMVLSEQGALAAMPSTVPDLAVANPAGFHLAPVPLQVTWPDGTTAAGEVRNPRAGPVWLPDGSGVLIFTGYGLERYTESHGELVSERAEGIRTRGETGMFLIPR